MFSDHVLLESIVNKLLETRINPSLSEHGGGAELVGIKDDKVYIKLSGGCQGCARAKATLKTYIENLIKHVIPSISEVVDVTDHELGTNPYYKLGDNNE